MFQPTHYKVVSTPAQLKFWEKTMREDVNPEPSLRFSESKGGEFDFELLPGREQLDLTD